METSEFESSIGAICPRNPRMRVSIQTVIDIAKAMNARHGGITETTITVGAVAMQRA
jgi:hypothetical protein